MPSTAPTRKDDEILLGILDLRDGDGITCVKIGEPLGRSKASILGATNRVYNDELPCACKKPENMNGGMPRGWWK